jgi:hypothetical protein
LTKIEVAVLALILLAVVGVLLSVLPRARERSDLIECKFHLKQLGAALIRFDGGRNFLPASRIADRYATWAVQLGPYLAPRGDDPLNAWDLQKPYADQTDTARKTLVPQFFCPARPRESRESIAGDLDAEGRQLPGAVGDYGCASGNTAALPWNGPKASWDGREARGPLIIGKVLKRDQELILGWRGRTALAKMGDNKSYKILVGDKHVPSGHFGQASAGDGSLYNGANPSSSARVAGPGYGLSPAPDSPFNLNFGSCHLGGVCQFAMADGAVKDFTPDTDESLLGRLADRYAPPEKKR